VDASPFDGCIDRVESSAEISDCGYYQGGVVGIPFVR